MYFMLINLSLDKTYLSVMNTQITARCNSVLSPKAKQKKLFDIQQDTIGKATPTIFKLLP